MEFKKWFSENITLGTEYVDESQINAIYNKARYAVKLVQMYDMTLPKNLRLLPNISVIANLTRSPNIFGLFNSAENKKIISDKVKQKIKFKFGDDVFSSQKINKIPEVVIRKYIPDISPDEIQQSDIIHVDVKNILSRYGDSPEAIVEIASTIVHECTHELEVKLTGSTRDGPGSAVEKAEAKFKKWVEMNKRIIAQRIPQIGFSV
jgi:hypothetical protein